MFKLLAFRPCCRNVANHTRLPRNCYFARLGLLVSLVVVVAFVVAVAVAAGVVVLVVVAVVVLYVVVQGGSVARAPHTFF